MPESRTVPDLLDELAATYPRREALVGGGRRYAWASLRTEVRRFAKGLHALGVRRGDHVGILMGNRPEWVIADLAILALGGVMVAVNTWVTARELEYVLAHSDCRVLVMSGRFLRHDYAAMLDGMTPRERRLPLLGTVVCIPGGGMPEGAIAFDDVAALGEGVAESAIDAERRAIRPEDVGYLLYTSGSTATPKGVRLQHFALIENMWNIGERLHVTAEDRLWLAVSLFWSLACANALFTLMTHGGSIVLQEHFDAEDALRLIERERCTVFYGTPNMALALAEHPGRTGHELASLRTGATIGTPEQLMRLVAMGVGDICNIYGLTETYGNCAVTDARMPVEKRVRCVGAPLPGVEVRIADPATGAALPAGGVGEIRVKGYVTVGYHKDAERTREAFDADGFFRTGDLGLLDDEGHLHFRGRLKEMVKTGGINVAPVEVEEVLMAHPGVRLAFVCGIPDPVRDEALAAAVVPEAGPPVTSAELQAHCAAALAGYKVPRVFRFVAEKDLPLTVTGKVQKSRLPELFAAAPAA